MAKPQVMLTTIDNPFSPFTQYDQWLAYDLFAGHYSNSLLARIANSSDDLSDADQEIEVENAMNEIIQENASGVHRLAYSSEKFEETEG